MVASGMVTDCHVCARLWRQFAAITMEAIRIDNKLKTAALQHNYEIVAILTIEAKAAFISRDQAREIIRLHDLAEHGDSGAANPRIKL